VPAVLAFQRLHQAIQHGGSGIGAIQAAKLGPGLRLAGLQPAKHIFREQRSCRVVTGGFADQPPGSHELLDNMAFQFTLMMNLAHCFLCQL